MNNDMNDDINDNVDGNIDNNISGNIDDDIYARSTPDSRRPRLFYYSYRAVLALY